jgi:hypothetical protein
MAHKFLFFAKVVHYISTNYKLMYAMDFITNDTIPFLVLQYEREMVELRRAMESLQVKLNRAEERLFGHDSPSHGAQGRRESDNSFHSHSPHSPALSVANSESNRSSRAVEENSKEMEQLLQRFQSAEEEMKREQELLTALDKKQKLIEAQEQKVCSTVC